MFGNKCELSGMAQLGRTVEDDASRATDRLAWRRFTPVTRMPDAGRFGVLQLTLLRILACTEPKGCTREAV